MALAIEKETKKEMIFETESMGHTFLNMLKEVLYKDSSVKAVSYKIEHPLVKKAKFILHTDGKEEPRDALKKAVKNIKTENTKMEKEIGKALK
ncbi:MAG: RpoL/Rpb11 RNA polymerase subunit family protein [Nanobdellota archaeon]